MPLLKLFKLGNPASNELAGIKFYDFLLFVKIITLKSFFHMIKGTRKQQKINDKSMQIRCSKKECTNYEKYANRESKWEP